MRDRLHHPATEATPESGRRDTRLSQVATARGRTPGPPGGAGATLAAAALALGALVLVGPTAPAAAQPTSTDAARAGQAENAATAWAQPEAPAATERPAASLSEIAGPAGSVSVAERAVASRGVPAAGTADAVDAGQEKSLYERLGGLYPIASVVDVFIDLLLHNDVLNENPAIRKARNEVPAPGLKYHVTAMICQATGGPCEYTGRSMKAAHAHLNIGEREWKAMLSDFRRTLNDFQVPEQEQQELVAIVQSTKDDIVVEE